MGITDLPYDIIVELSKRLRLRDLSSFGQVNRTTYANLEEYLYICDARIGGNQPGYPAFYWAISQAKADPDVALRVACKALDAYVEAGATRAQGLLTGKGVLYHPVDFLLNQSFFSWYSPVMLSALRGSPEMLELVIKHEAGCDIDLANRRFDFQPAGDPGYADK